MALNLIKKADAEYAIMGALELASINESQWQKDCDKIAEDAVTVNCSQVSGCDSAGIALLVHLKKSAILKRRQITFIQLTQQMLQLIAMMGLKPIFEENC